MGEPLMWHLFSFAAIFSLGLYHLVCSTRSHLLHRSSYVARPYYPLPHRNHFIHHLPLYLTLPTLFLSSILIPTLSPPQLLLPSLHLTSILLLFSLILLSLPFFPNDLSFLLLSLPFLLLSRLQPFPLDDVPLLPIHFRLSSISSSISLSSALLSLALALRPRLFPAELALSTSVLLRGLWSLQSGLSLYSDAFVPEGCHRLLDVPPELSTRCELQAYRSRAEQIVDFAFALHASLAAAVAVAVYAAVARGASSGVRRSYEALPTSAPAGSLGEVAMDHVQMKALAKSSAQA